ncbi:MAG: 3-isopropylmalate dehydrogenase [Lachnospiraceae bacterium]|nr:3-isopropylmalate dehydrogenase [Lachnospiraceae bacterium]
MGRKKSAAAAAESNAGRLQWHPAFSSAFQIELAEDIEELLINVEYQLTRKPLIMDVLVIKKADSYKCRNKIAEFFRGHNIIEYKNPQESYGINDLCRTFAYAGIYQSNTEREAEIDPADITITVVCGKLPRKVIHKLKEMYGIVFHMCEPGIYRADQNMPFPLQFIINTGLDPEKFKWLSRLRCNLTVEADVKVLANEYRGKEKNLLYETAMDVIMRANKGVYREAKGMCQALRELFAEELEERENKGVEQGESKLGMLISQLFADGRIGDARQAASDEKLRKKYYQEYGMMN